MYRELMQAALAASLLVSGGADAAPASPPAAAEPVNALWNDSDGGFGLWLYGTPGGCPQVRFDAKSFLVVVMSHRPKADEAPAELALSDVKTCAVFGPNHKIELCRSATLILRFDRATNEYRGTYRAFMSDGTGREGSLRAQYCKQT